MHPQPYAQHHRDNRDGAAADLRRVRAALSAQLERQPSPELAELRDLVEAALLDRIRAGRRARGEESA